MTISASELAFYGFGIFLLFITPGPVWVALIARALSGGFAAAWPLALGVTLGDLVWPFLAILGVTWILSVYGDFLELMRWVATATFLVMGYLVIRAAGKPIDKNSHLTRPGKWAGFLAGLAVIVGNPKAILFYMGMLPGFFDLTRLTWPDIAAICARDIHEHRDMIVAAIERPNTDENTSIDTCIATPAAAKAVSPRNLPT